MEDKYTRIKKIAETVVKEFKEGTAEDEFIIKCNQAYNNIFYMQRYTDENKETIETLIDKYKLLQDAVDYIGKDTKKLKEERDAFKENYERAEKRANYLEKSKEYESENQRRSLRDLNKAHKELIDKYESLKAIMDSDKQIFTPTAQYFADKIKTRTAMYRKRREECTK